MGGRKWSRVESHCSMNIKFLHKMTKFLISSYNFALIFIWCMYTYKFVKRTDPV